MTEAAGADVRAIWDALARGELAPLEHALAPDAHWYGVDEDAAGCHGRAQVVGMMARGLAGGLSGSIEEAIELGARVIVGFRPKRRVIAGFDPSSPPAQRPLDRGLAYVVVTRRDGQIVELKGCADRAAALAYAQAATS